jgi:Protein of unknown function (DUF1552)
VKNRITKRSKAAAQLGRRLFLRGAGGASLVLPNLLWRVGDTRAADPAPDRLFTLFFGNGLPPEIGDEGTRAGAPLSPLAPYDDRLAIIRGIRSQTTGAGDAHDHGAASFACGLNAIGRDIKGGPSLDWVAYSSVNPGTPLPVFAAGVFGPEQLPNRVRWVHSWRGQAQPNLPPLDTLTLFRELFAPAAPPPGPELQSARKRSRLDTSVLDAIVADYRRIVSPASGLPNSAKSYIGSHLETVRALEQRALNLKAHLEDEGGETPRQCIASNPPESSMVTSVPRLQAWATLWPLIVDLVVAAIRCDIVRFGSLTLLSAGESYPYNGPEGNFRSTHGYAYHVWPRQHENAVRSFVRWTADRIAEWFKALDSGVFADAAGGSLFHNSVSLVGTEIADPSTHSREDMTFILGGGRGRLRTGIQRWQGRSEMDLYDGVLATLGGVPVKIGERRFALEPLVLLR